MGEPHVISALTAKRAAISGEIEACQQRIAELQNDLLHIDATLRIFDPEIQPDTIRPKKALKRDDFFGHGEIPRRCLDILRRGGVPLDSTALAIRMLDAKKLATNDRRFLLDITAKTDRTLCQLRRRGLVASTRRDGKVEWEIAA